MDWSVKVDAFIREFDLVTLGSATQIASNSIRCRKFQPWRRGDSHASMVMRPIAIGSRCNISGMVSPGVSIGDRCKLTKLSALQEGAQVPDDVLAKGSPAYYAGKLILMAKMMELWQQWFLLLEKFCG